VAETVPGCSIEYAGKADPDNRTYIVDFSKLATTLPTFQPKWTRAQAPPELYQAYHIAQLQFDDFQAENTSASNNSSTSSMRAD